MNGNTPESKLPERLRKAAESLNKESDALTNSLKQVEQALKSLGLGIEVQLKAPVREEQDGGTDGVPPFTWKEYLGYGKSLGKSGNEWGLYILAESEDGPPDPSIRGIAELPREDRILMAKHLPALLDLMADEAEKMVKQVEDARVSAQEALKRLLKK